MSDAARGLSAADLDARKIAVLKRDIDAGLDSLLPWLQAGMSDSPEAKALREALASKVQRLRELEARRR